MRRDKVINLPGKNDGMEEVAEYGALGFAYVPLVRARLSAGGGGLETEDEELGVYAFRSEWIRRRGGVSHMVLMRVTGDSMEPEVKDGDMVLINKEPGQQLIAGGIYAVGIDDMVVVKIVDAAPGRIILRSMNPGYPPVEVDLRGDLADGVRIIGRVIWWCREAR